MPISSRSALAFSWPFSLPFVFMIVPTRLSQMFFFKCMVSIEYQTAKMCQYSNSYSMNFLFHIPSSWQSSSPPWLTPHFRLLRTVLTSLNHMYTSLPEKCGGGFRVSLVPPNCLSMLWYRWFFGSHRLWPIYANLFEFFSHKEHVSDKQWEQPWPFLLLCPDKLRWAGLSLMVVISITCKVKCLLTTGSLTSTPSQRRWRSSTRGWRNTWILSPGCFGSETNGDSMIYLRLLQNHGGRFMIDNRTGHVLCDVVMFPYGFIPSVLRANLIFLGSSPNQP